MKLELKHLAPYLPYGLEVKTDKWIEEIGSIDGITGNLKDIRLTLIINRDKEKTKAITWTPLMEHCKPILRPLSDLTKVIQHNGDEFIPYIEYNYISDFLEELSTLDHTYMGHVQYKVINVLFELHFDVFGLIEKELAIDKNKIAS
jgi:hypothetical protein